MTPTHPSPRLADALSVATGAALGGLMRHLLTARTLPLAQTLARVCLINTAGSFALGAAAALQRAKRVSPRVGLALSVGVCGGFTTFSTFAAGLLGAAREERYAVLAVYMGASCVMGVAGVAAGEAAVRGWLRR